MTFSRTQLDAINEAGVGQLAIARHPQRPIVLVTIVGTAVVLGFTTEQVDNVIQQLTIMRDRILESHRVNLPYVPTPTSGPQ